LNLYTYVENNPLANVDPSGHMPFNIAKGLSDWVTDMFHRDQSDNIPSSVKTATIGTANFLILDDVNTLRDPEATGFEKSIAAASITPWGKLFTAGKLAIVLVKVASKGEDAVSAFKSFNALKKALGPAGEGKAWHHLVEQSQVGKRAYFAVGDVQNINNVVSVPTGSGSIHEAISGFYSSTQPFSGGKTVRDWLGATKTFEEQFEFGLTQLRKYGNVEQTNTGWVFTPSAK
jgi:hypothetical protein